jgi:hypothetical protein
MMATVGIEGVVILGEHGVIDRLLPSQRYGGSGVGCV